MGYNFAFEVDRIARRNPDKTAIQLVQDLGAAENITYDMLRRQSNQMAHALLQRGIGKGSRVVVLLQRGIAPYLVYLALLKVGATIMPGSEMLRGSDIRYRINHAQADAVIAEHKLTSEVDAVRHECASLTALFSVGGSAAGWTPLESIYGEASDADLDTITDDEDIAFISYTSGTTAGPKGVMHSYLWAKEHLAVAGTYWFDAQPSDVAWATAAPGWGKWIWSPFVSVLGNGSTALVYTGRFDPERYLQLMEEHHVTLLCATPTEYRLMAKVDNLARFNLTLRSACSAGEPLNREVIERFQRAFGVTVRDGYGQTESTLLVGTLRDMEVRPGSMGKPFPGTRVAIVNDAGQILPPGEIGHIAVHKSHPALFKGYLADEERTKKAYIGEWYITGDNASADDDGYFWFEGRSDDIIISSGYTIGPFEVEDALVKHAKVAECAVVASPDPERGHIVKAFVILRNPADKADPALVKELQQHVKRVTAPYKYPRAIEFVDTLPKTNSGKIRRIELRQMEEGR